MSKWASRWPGEYAFKDGPSRRGPDRQHKSTIVSHTRRSSTTKLMMWRRRYREIRLRQKEIERQRRRSFVMEAQAPPRPPSPAKPSDYRPAMVASRSASSGCGSSSIPRSLTPSSCVYGGA